MWKNARQWRLLPAGKVVNPCDELKGDPAIPCGGCTRDVQCHDGAPGFHRKACTSKPSDHPGGDLEQGKTLDKFLAKRAHPRNKNIVLLAVGDTRDHRRKDKDPALRTISYTFLLNLLANLESLDIRHYAILTTPKVCRLLHTDHCQRSSLPGLDGVSA